MLAPRAVAAGGRAAAGLAEGPDDFMLQGAASLRVKGGKLDTASSFGVRPSARLRQQFAQLGRDLWPCSRSALAGEEACGPSGAALLQEEPDPCHWGNAVVARAAWPHGPSRRRV